MQLKKKDGEVIWVMISGAPYYDLHGDMVGSIGVHYDITEQKRLRANLQRAKLLAEQAQKAEQNFLSNMSHEIRTPLNAIIGMAHLLKDTPLDEEQGEYLDILNNSARVLLALISDILDLTKIDTGTVEVQSKPFNLVNVMNFLQRTFSVKAESKPVEVTCKIDPRIDKMLIGDELLINQILLNLIGNSEKFTESGFVSFEAKMVDKNDKSTTIKFTIADSGIGISQEKIKIIFDDFKQASSDITRKFGGTGLGLAITKKLIALLGGEIHVVSEENKGTTFWFELEFENSELELFSNEEEQTSLVVEEKIDPILVVEDNHLNQIYLTKILEKWSLPYEVAQNGQEGVDMANEKSYSLILMDIQMPILSGYEAAKLIREHLNPNQKTTIIALTASTLLSKKQKALDSGMDDYLAKPFTPIQLSSVLRKYIKSSIIQNKKIIEKKSSVFKLDQDLLETTYGDDYEYAIEMFETFLSINETEFSLIENAFQNKDQDELGRIIHKVKPTFSMVGLPQMTKFMQHFEITAKEKSWDHVINEYNQFVDLVKTNIPLIKQQLDHYKSKS